MNFKFESISQADKHLESEIRGLECLCNTEDETHYSLFLENAYNADRTIDYIYLLRKGDQLISVLVLFFPDISDIEVYGFTHPDYRKRGLFSRLIEATHTQLKPTGTYSHLFVCDPSCLSGRAFLRHIGTELEETEYMMELSRTDFDSYLNKGDHIGESLALREASLDDVQSISAIASIMYEEEQTNSGETIKQTILSEKREQLLGFLGDELIGICTIGQEEGSMMINGLAIDRSYQGRGLGRDLLNQVLSYTFEKYGQGIKLEVSSINDRAYKLYKSVGFQQRESYGYYRGNAQS